MPIQGEEKGTYYLIVLHKDFTVKNLFEVRKIIEQAMELGHKVIVFNMTVCSSVDSSAIGLVENLSKRCNLQGGKIGLLKPSESIKELISVTNLESLVRIYNSEAEIEADL